jgi:CRP/FNR family transcriptional regulator, dissimilatory nitrate respiration regulator
MPKSRIRIDNFLINLPLFKGLEEDAIARLARGTAEIEAPRGTVLFCRGDPCTGFHIVVFGQVKLSVHTDRGDEKVVEVIDSGMSFGEPAMFLGRPHIVTAETVSDSKILHMAKEVMLDELQRDSHFSQCLIATLCDRLYQGISELEDYFLRSATERVVRYLLRGDNGSAARDILQVTLSSKKGIIASRLNLTHEHFSRILRELMTDGLIEVEGREVRILDRKRLCAHGG